jgi:hypothetical protein
VLARVDGRPRLLLRGLYRGSRAASRLALAQLLERAGTGVDFEVVGPYSELHERLTAVPGLPPLARRELAAADSRYLSRVLTEQEWAHLIERWQRLPSVRSSVGFEPYGGAISAVAPEATAFVHRQSSLNVFAWAIWENEKAAESAKSYLRAFAADLDPLGNGEACQNYPSRENLTYRTMYWRDSFSTLLAVRRKYDPGGLFRGGQPVSADREDTDSTLGSANHHVVDLKTPIERPDFLWRPSRWSGWTI